MRQPTSTSSAAESIGLTMRLSCWLESVLIQTLLTLVLWPLKLIYRRPQETWRAWHANQKLCSLDRRFC